MAETITVHGEKHEIQKLEDVLIQQALDAKLHRLEVETAKIFKDPGKQLLLITVALGEPSTQGPIGRPHRVRDRHRPRCRGSPRKAPDGRPTAR